MNECIGASCVHQWNLQRYQQDIYTTNVIAEGSARKSVKESFLDCEREALPCHHTHNNKGSSLQVPLRTCVQGLPHPVDMLAVAVRRQSSVDGVVELDEQRTFNIKTNRMTVKARTLVAASIVSRFFGSHSSSPSVEVI